VLKAHLGSVQKVLQKKKDHGMWLLVDNHTPKKEGMVRSKSNVVDPEKHIIC